MKLIIMSLIMTLMPMYAYSAFVASSIDGTIIYLPKEGSIIKKGEPLVKYDTIGIDYQIAKAKLEIKFRKEEVEDSKTDLIRSQSLCKTKSVSDAYHEDVVVSYHESLNNYKASKLDLDILIWDRESYLIKSPFKLKVIKYIMIPNSGAGVGDQILEVEVL